MKKLATTLGIVVLVGMLVGPALAHRRGWGDGMRGPGYCWDEGGGSVNLTENQRAELNNLERKFFNDTSELRKEIWGKSDKLDILMDSAAPDPKQARQLQKEISKARTKLSEKRMDFELEARKISPDSAYAKGYGRGGGRGYGRHMRGRGARGSYGPGACWD